MKLGIVSDCIHYKNDEGKIGTENHIFLRQMQALASHYSKTLIACPFDTIDKTKVISWYNDSIDFEELPMAGGETWKAKFEIIKILPKWIKAFKAIDKFADIVYQRFPNNVNIPGFLYFYLKNKKVFGTYTGTWKYYEGEPITYRLQRWILRNFFRGPVWVYTVKERLNKRINSGFSPSYSKIEWEEEIEQVHQRKLDIKNKGISTVRLISVGKLIYYKNQIAILKACVVLKESNFPFTLKIVGDGPMESELNAFVNENKLEREIEFTGKKTYQELKLLYRQSDFVVQAPLYEGFGKVPVEAFFHGVIPILNNVGMAGYMIGNDERGFLFDATNPQNLANLIMDIKNKISELPCIIDKGRDFSKTQTLENWGNEYYAAVCEFYK